MSGLPGEFHRLADFLAAAGMIGSAEEYRRDLAARAAFVRRCQAYALIAPRCAGVRALDIGCSLGHGARLLAAVASGVAAVDSGERVLEAAARARPAGNVRYARADALRLPFPDGSFGVVAAFHLIEHLPTPDVVPFLREALRVTAAGGEVVVVTPNRRFRLLPGQPPFNPEHRREYSRRGLVRALAAVFEDVSVLGIRGRKWVEELERARLRRSPFRAYLRDPAVSLLKCAWPGLRLRRRPRAGRAAPPAAPEGEGCQIGLGDFWADARRPERGIDLLAVCRKG